MNKTVNVLNGNYEPISYSKNYVEQVILEKDKEIDRLKAREQECLDAYRRARQDVSKYEGKYVVAKYVINELEKWLDEQENHTTYPSMIFIGSVKAKLKELKGGINNENK